MKKFYILAMAALLLTACKNTQQSGEETKPVQTETESEPIEPPAGEAKAGAEEPALLETARQYALDVLNGNYDSMEQNYDYSDKMEALVKDGSLKKSFEQATASLGAVKETGGAYAETVQEFVTVSVPCRLEKGEVNVNVVFDRENKLAGVNFGRYAEKEDASSLKAQPEGVREIDMELKPDDSHTLPGTLTLPSGEGPYPVVVLVHGSGPSGRDEKVGNVKVFQDLAWGLAAQGIATYRYDKRTYVYGGEAAADVTLTVNEETVDDAAAAVSMVAELEEVNPDRVYVLGHSLGGYMIPRIAEKTPEAGGYIMMAGPSGKMTDLMGRQYQFLAGLDGTVTEEEKKQLEQIEAELEKAAKPEALGEGEAIMGAYPAYWKDLNSYDALEEAEKITKPVLALQGEEDYQVPMEEFERWKERYGDRENWTFESFPGLTHLMTEGKKENGPADYQKANMVDSRVFAAIEAFISGTEDES